MPEAQFCDYNRYSVLSTDEPVEHQPKLSTDEPVDMPTQNYPDCLPYIFTVSPIMEKQ